MGFSLTKWYLDVVTEDGRVAIAYWAEARWARLRQRLCGLLLETGSATAPWRFSGRAVPAPTFDEKALRWIAEPLALRVDFARRQPSFRHRLLDTSSGVVDWNCEVPRAEARIQAGDTVLEGLGYAERLDLTILPWQIPTDEIRWGRFLSPRTSVVWIDWRGEVSRRLVFLDGIPMTSCSISDTRIAGDGMSTLVLDESRVVTDDHLGDLLAPLEALGPLVTPIARIHQTRWLARGVLDDPGPAAERGWALHELVRRT